MTETQPGEWRYQFTALRVLALIGLAFSSALATDLAFGVGTYCGANDPCAEVAESSYSELAGVPLAVVGLFAFGVFFALALVPTAFARTAARVLAVIAGLAGVILIAIQCAVIHHVCPLCVVTDTCAILMAVVALIRRPSAARPSWLWVRNFGWAWAGLAAALGPLFWAAAHLPTKAPDPVRAYWVPGKITVVEVTDFDCPHCQRADPIVRAWLKQHPDVKFVRVVSPLPAHMNGRPAGLAYLAAVRLGKGEAMAEGLYAAQERDPNTCRQIAIRIGLDPVAYDREVKNPDLETVLNNNQRWVRPTDLGLPFFWVQDELVVGAPKPEDLDRALQRAKPAS